MSEIGYTETNIRGLKDARGDFVGCVDFLIANMGDLSAAAEASTERIAELEGQLNEANDRAEELEAECDEARDKATDFAEQLTLAVAERDELKEALAETDKVVGRHLADHEYDSAREAAAKESSGPNRD